MNDLLLIRKIIYSKYKKSSLIIRTELITERWSKFQSKVSLNQIEYLLDIFTVRKYSK